MVISYWLLVTGYWLLVYTTNLKINIEITTNH